MATLIDPTNTYSQVNLAANYQRYTPTTQMGTRTLRVIKVLLSGGSPPNLSTSYTTSTSNYAKAVRTFQTYFETWAVFTPTATGFLAIVSDDTAQDSDAGTNVIGGYGQVEAAILGAIGDWGSGAVTLSVPTLTIGTTL
jgi:hypothetical protein